VDIIDTHQHLIYRDHLRYEWVAKFPALATSSFTLPDYHALTKDKGIVATLFMEANTTLADYQNEAQFVAGLMDAHLVGQIAACYPETDAGFDAWLEEGQGLRVKGYRRILHESPDDLSQSTIFRANLRKIGARGLPFDLCFLARQHSIAEDLLRACDDQSFILDHCGVPDIAGGGFADWAASLRRLAAFPHLTCKLSGITAYAGGRHGLADLHPYIDHVLACFGPDRIVWGSDWPVTNLGGGLPLWLAQTQSVLANLSQDEAAAIAHKNARRIYGL
jgi:predicted TIM-barrel fold metal-dependent hydrolase